MIYVYINSIAIGVDLSDVIAFCQNRSVGICLYAHGFVNGIRLCHLMCSVMKGPSKYIDLHVTKLLFIERFVRI